MERERTVVPWPEGPPAGWIVDLAGWSAGGSPFYDNMKHRHSFTNGFRKAPGVGVSDTAEEAAESALEMLNLFQAVNHGGHWDVEPGGVAWAGLRPVDAAGRVMSPAEPGSEWRLLFAESPDGRTPPVLMGWDGESEHTAEVRPHPGRLDGYEPLAETEKVIRRRMRVHDGYEIDMRVSPAGAGYTGEFAVHCVDKPPSPCLEGEYSGGDLAGITYTVTMDYRRLAAAASDEEAVEAARDIMGDWLEEWSILDQASDYEPALVGRVRRGASPWLMSAGNGREPRREWSPGWTQPGEAEQDILVYPSQRELPAMASYTDGSPSWTRAEVLSAHCFPLDWQAVREAVGARFGALPVTSPCLSYFDRGAPDWDAPDWLVPGDAVTEHWRNQRRRSLTLVENRPAPARRSVGAGW